MALTESIGDWVRDAGIGRLSLLVVAIGIQIYFVNITTPIPNFDENSKTVYYGVSDIVVPTNISSTHAIISSSLILAIWYVSRRETDKFQILTHNQCKEIVDADIARLKKEDLRFENAKIKTTDFTLRRILINDNFVPNRYIWISKINPPLTAGSVPFYFRHDINPYTGYIERRFEETTPITSQILCGNCGKTDMVDIKLITSQEFADYALIKKSLEGR